MSFHKANYKKLKVENINLNNKVYAFSGYKSGKIIEYNEFAEEIKT